MKYNNINIEKLSIEVDNITTHYILAWYLIKCTINGKNFKRRVLNIHELYSLYSSKKYLNEDGKKRLLFLLLFDLTYEFVRDKAFGKKINPKPKDIEVMKLLYANFKNEYQEEFGSNKLKILKSICDISD